MALERWAQSQLITTADVQEAVMAFMSKRPAKFEGASQPSGFRSRTMADSRRGNREGLGGTSLRGWLLFQFFLALLLFLPAGTVDYPQAWAYWLVFGLATAAVTIYFLRRIRRWSSAACQ